METFSVPPAETHVVVVNVFLITNKKVMVCGYNKRPLGVVIFPVTNTTIVPR